MDLLTAVVVAANTVTLVFGGAIVLFAYRAHVRTGSQALRALSIGLGLVTLGALLGGSLHQLVGASLVESVAVQSSFSAAGFVVLAYALVAEHSATKQVVGSPLE